MHKAPVLPTEVHPAQFVESEPRMCETIGCKILAVGSCRIADPSVKKIEGCIWWFEDEISS